LVVVKGFNSCVNIAKMSDLTTNELISALVAHIISLVNTKHPTVYIGITNRYESLKPKLEEFVVKRLGAQLASEANNKPIDLALLIDKAQVSEFLKEQSDNLDTQAILVILSQDLAPDIKDMSHLGTVSIKSLNQNPLIISFWTKSEVTPERIIATRINTLEETLSALGTFYADLYKNGNLEAFTQNFERQKTLWLNDIKKTEKEMQELRKTISDIYNTKTFRMTKRLRYYWALLRRLVNAD
jgi:hypothetical protein